MESNMRKLASIQKIESLEPIEGADRIEKARVLGWDVVVKKTEKIIDLPSTPHHCSKCNTVMLEPRYQCEQCEMGM